MAILDNRKQIQPKWPLRIDPQVGPYASVVDTAASLKQDFVFLLLTIPGEWPMNPDLGVGLATYLFENHGSLELLEVKARIQSQLSKYLPNIELINATFQYTEEERDENMSNLKIVYAIPDLGLEDEMDFGLNEVSKTVVYRSEYDTGFTKSRVD